LAFVMRFARRRGANPLLAGFLLAVSTAWATWATGGLETALFAACVTVGTLALALGLEARDPRAPRWLLASAVCFGLGCLTRPDGPLPAACAALVVLVQALRGRLAWRSALVWLALLAAI